MEYSLASRYIAKWGPCTRTILKILREDPQSRPNFENELKSAAKRAAAAVYDNPTALESINDPQGIHRISSPLIFFRPHRPLGEHSNVVASS